MLTIFAEVKHQGQWQKVGRVFTSAYEELSGELTDRVYDKPDASFGSFLAVHSYEGLPEDVSNEIAAHRFFQGDLVYHASLDQLLNFNWDEVRSKIGYITEWQYARLKQDGLKPVTVLDKTIDGTRTVSPFFMDMVFQFPSMRTTHKYYVRYEYNHQLVREQYAFFCETSIPSLINLIPEGGSTEDVRIVFAAQ